MVDLQLFLKRVGIVDTVIERASRTMILAAPDSPISARSKENLPNTSTGTSSDNPIMSARVC